MTRDQRLATLADNLRERENIAQIRLGNAERAIGEATRFAELYPPQTLEACRAERDLARQALREIHERQSLFLRAQGRHHGDSLDGTTIFPDGTVLLVVDSRSGERYVVDRHDGDNPSILGAWYRHDGDIPMTFDEAIGVDEGYAGHEYFRLYTCDQVDDMLDRAGVDDLFA